MPYMTRLGIRVGLAACVLLAGFLSLNAIQRVVISRASAASVPYWAPNWALVEDTANFSALVNADAGSAFFGGRYPMMVAYPNRTGAAPGSDTSTVVTVNAKARTASLNLVAGSTTNNSGFNFNGASKGQLVVSVPIGYKVTIRFSNAAALPHSAVVTAYAKRSAGAFPPAFSGATTSNATSGLGKGVRQAFTFTATKVGRYAIVCAVPGHAAAGMWDVLQVTKDGLASPAHPHRPDQSAVVPE